MKQKQQTTISTRAQTFKTIAPDGYPLYIRPEEDPYTYLVAPNPPTPEAVAKAQFVDKTYVWKEATTQAKHS